MLKKPLIGVSICAVVLLVLGSLSNVVGYQIIQSSDEKVPMTCSFFTLHGVEQVEKELSVQDAAYLSLLMNSSDSVFLASELSRYGLLPQAMTVEQATEVINGGSLQKKIQQTQQFLDVNQSLDSDWMSNSLCSVRGSGLRSLYTTPRFLVWSTALVYALCFFITIPGIFIAWVLSHLFNDSYSEIIFWSTLWFFYLPQFIVENLYWDMGQWINPIKLPSAVVVAHLTTWDWAGDVETPYLNVSGINGTWTIENYTGIGIHMIGFFGVWLSQYNKSNRASAQFRGYCLHINAKGLDDRFWDGWHDWPWL